MSPHLVSVRWGALRSLALSTSRGALPAAVTALVLAGCGASTAEAAADGDAAGAVGGDAAGGGGGDDTAGVGPGVPEVTSPTARFAVALCARRARCGLSPAAWLDACYAGAKAEEGPDDGVFDLDAAIAAGGRSPERERA